MVDAEGSSLSEEFLEQVPNRPAVFLISLREGRPYLARTSVLKRRLNRLARISDFRERVARIAIWYTGSALEAQIKLYEQARLAFPKTYLETLHLRLPAYVKLMLANPFPRTAVGSQFNPATSTVCGPFRSRASAESFEAGVLDLFQVRRCFEDLVPSEDHPGCMYGEMGRCLRPCQQAVSREEYFNEVLRAGDFLTSSGRSLIDSAEAARNRFSEELDFEQAAKQHERIVKIEDVMKLRDELARPLSELNGLAVLPSVEKNAVELGLIDRGHWQGFTRLIFESVDGKPLSLDARLRTWIDSRERQELEPRDRQEYLAILARWFYSSWRDGEYLATEGFDHLPYRKLVNAISRVHRGVV